MFTDTYPPEINGVSTSCSSLRNALIKNHHEVLIVTTNHYVNKFYFDKKENVVHMPGFRLKMIYDYRLANPWFNSLVKKVDEIVVAFKPDVMHLQSEWGVALIGHRIAARHNIPTVYTYHTMWEEYAAYVTGKHFDRASRAFMRWYSRFNVKRCLEFITPSIKTKDYMRSIGIKNYINIIPTGIDFSLFKKTTRRAILANAKRRELGIKKSDKVFLVLGRIANEKSIDVIVRGFADYKNKFPKTSAYLVIVGDGPAMNSLKELAKQLHIEKFVIFTGVAVGKDVPIYYHMSDVYCSASLSETQGLTYMEAMASSLVCLSRFDNNLINVIIDDKTGYLFHNEKDFATVANKVLTLKKAKLKQIHHNAHTLIDNYSLDRFYKRVMEVYERAIRRNW